MTHFSARFRLPSIPIETYLRMMLLKDRYKLGYETLCREVADSLSWSRFCRVSLGTRGRGTLDEIFTKMWQGALVGVRSPAHRTLGQATPLRPLPDRTRA